MGAFKVTITADDENSSDGESTCLVVQHALSAYSKDHDQWILDSGATNHTCNNAAMFGDLQPLPRPLNVTLGDPNVQAIGQGNVVLMTNLLHGKQESCILHGILLFLS